MQLQNKVAMVTGAARGIGWAIAARFAREGAAVVLMDLRDALEASRRLNAEGCRTMPAEVDVTDPAAVNDAVQSAVRTFGTIDILVNNAGIIVRGTIMDLTHEAWRKVLDVNVNGTFNCCKAVIPIMVQHRSGRILNISSVAGKMGDVTAAPAYGASKGAINAFTKSLARQLAEYGVIVNAIAPHAIETDMSAEWSEERRQKVIDAIPLKRLGRPEDVADAAVFLVSDASTFITGEILDVNGGFLMD
jgi:3-oxoacyl-[acyl-carrier protein] reductase